MTGRERAWVNFARLLLPEMREERKLLEWIRDEEVDRIVAFPRDGETATLRTWMPTGLG